MKKTTLPNSYEAISNILEIDRKQRTTEKDAAKLAKSLITLGLSGEQVIDMFGKMEYSIWEHVAKDAIKTYGVGCQIPIEGIHELIS